MIEESMRASADQKEEIIVVSEEKTFSNQKSQFGEEDVKQDETQLHSEVDQHEIEYYQEIEEYQEMPAITEQSSQQEISRKMIAETGIKVVNDWIK